MPDLDGARQMRVPADALDKGVERRCVVDKNDYILPGQHLCFGQCHDLHRCSLALGNWELAILEIILFLETRSDEELLREPEEATSPDT